MSLLAPVDIYCERLAPGFWAEPVNALSNLAFVVAALVAWRTARRMGVSAPMLWVLIALAAMIGVGSFLFHTFANGWSEYADTIPIWSFVALYVLAAVHFLGGVAPGRLTVIAVVVAAVATVVFLASGEGAAPVAEAIPDPLNGSQQYAPALVALLVFTAVSWRRQLAMRGWITGATLAFMVSLAFRTVDMRVCAGFPLGTHFIWHLLNAVMIGLLLQALVRGMADRRGPERA
ncbi:ceramidase domain-containing protein [Thalassovita taeanensis]|uniref:Ceramidase n=1 Tax=Thalassovita taeanensis TaxID=657014 RepID=A0A1H9JU82_9RHOB|nr:ceramidase domain-containing protein [Thalassovita taeanensis]SEQ90476.1 Ceramidase [Thalassovita taeanensis]